MSAEERQTRGAAINALKNEITEAINARKTVLKDAAIEARLKAETVDVSCRCGLRRPSAAASTRSARSSTRSPPSSPTWDSRSPKARTSRPTTTTSRR
jgi:phenylalanyl-tRNA synthetase alpha subunit